MKMPSLVPMLLVSIGAVTVAKHDKHVLQAAVGLARNHEFNAAINKHQLARRAQLSSLEKERHALVSPKRHHERQLERNGTVEATKNGGTDEVTMNGQDVKDRMGAYQGSYNFMPADNIHLRTEEIGEPDGSVRGLEYLGVGYNLIMGNPYGGDKGQLDPGFRDPIIEHQFNFYHSWSEAQNQPCGYLGMDMECPAGVYVRREFQCNHASKATEISSSSEMAESLDTQATMESEVGGSFEGGGMGVEVEASFSARFSGSEGFKQSSSEMEDSNSEFFDATTLCTEFYVSYEKYVKPVLHGVFLDALAALPDFKDCDPSVVLSKCDADYLEYIKFINTYGTTYIDSVNMGAKKIHRLIIKSSEVTRLKSEGTDVAKEAAMSASVGGSGWGQSASIEGSHSESESKSQESSSSSSLGSSDTSTVDINVGGYPSDDWMEWAESVADRPMPVKYTMASIPSLLLKVDKAQYASKAEALTQAINSYANRNGVPDTVGADASGIFTLLGGAGLTKSLAFAIARVDGSQVSQNAETLQVHNVAGSAGHKTFTLPNEFSREPVALANQVYTSLTGFQKGMGSHRDTASIVSASQSSISTLTCHLMPGGTAQFIDRVTTLIVGLNTPDSGILFGKINGQDGTPMGSTNNDFSSQNLPKGFGTRDPSGSVVEVKMDKPGYMFEDPAVAPAVVVVADVRRSSSSMEDAGRSGFHGVNFDKSLGTNGTWKAYFTAGDSDHQNNLNFLVAGFGCAGATVCNDRVMNQGIPGLTWATWTYQPANPGSQGSACDESMSGDGADYRGCQIHTTSGHGCQAWASQTPHQHGNSPEQKPDAGLEANYCRNPDGEPSIWCYTTDPNVRWKSCDPLPQESATDATAEVLQLKSNRGISKVELSSAETESDGYSELSFDTTYQKQPSCIVSQMTFGIIPKQANTIYDVQYNYELPEELGEDNQLDGHLDCGSLGTFDAWDGVWNCGHGGVGVAMAYAVIRGIDTTKVAIETGSDQTNNAKRSFSVVCVGIPTH